MSFLTKADRQINHHPYLSAFIISLVMLLIYSVIQGIYPFGSATFLRKDLYHQYLPFLYEFRRRLINGESLQYSFDLGLGSSFYAMYVYYLSDPLNFLSVLIPEDYLLEFLTAITCLKIALASSFMCRYLRYRIPENPVLISVLFSLCYGFSGYIASFDWNVMWMWGIALAPLVIMGFERLYRGEGSGLYIITWALTVWTNYYIAMVMGIFLVLYFFILTIEEYRGIIPLLKSAVRALSSTIVSAGISTVLLLPEWAAIKETSFTGKAFPSKLRFYLSLPELMTRSLMAVKVETGLGHEPALYASLVMLFILPLFFLNRRIPLRFRITRGALILFFYLSFDTNVLEFIWHGLNYPDSIPARQAFLFVIVCITCACCALNGIRDIGRKRLAAATAFPVLFYNICLVFCKGEDHTDAFTWIISVLFILMYLVIAFELISGKKDFGRWVFPMFAAVLMAELIFNFNMTSLRDVSRKAYFKHKDSYRALAEEAAGDDVLNEGLFTRLDTADENIRNISSLSGYHDLSYFSSTIDNDIVDFYRSFGMKASRVHYMGEGLTPFTSAIMGAGYVLANDIRNNQTDDDVAVYVDENNEDYLYKNIYSLPLGYTIPAGHYELYEDDTIPDPLYLQNAAALRLGGEKVFIIEDDDCIYEEKGKAVIDIPEKGHYYAWSSSDAGKITEYTDFSDEPFGIFKDLKYKSILDLGQLDKGCRVTLEYEDQVFPSLRLYRLDTSAMENLVENLMHDRFTLTDFSEDHIEGIVDISENRQLFLAIPADEGWEIVIDGTDKIEPDSFYGLFMLISVPPGCHKISLTYNIPYFKTGFIISLTCIFAAVLIPVIEALRKSRTASRHKP